MDSEPTSAPAPAEAGYRWPAEWEPHEATWVTWPHNPDTWPGHLEHAEREFTEFVAVLARFEPVRILCASESVRERASRLLREAARARRSDPGNIQTLLVPTNDSWVRDYGPTFLVHGGDGHLAAVDWQYNAWGGKYPPWDDDQRAAAAIARQCGCPRFEVDWILEGGAIEGNGAGTLLTTEACLLHPNRNTTATREQMEHLLADYLAARRVGWLSGEGILGDDTDGHIDQLARFVGPARVVAASSDDPDDPQHAPLADNLARLSREQTADGRPLEVIRLPMPAAKYCQGQRLPACYCNFYIANGAVLVPRFEDPADAEALGLLGELFPDRQVLGLPALELVWGLGAFHCLTQQQPRST